MAVADAPTRALGTLGPGTYRGWADALADAAEHIPDLRYPWSREIFTKMRLDPTLTSILAAYVRPIVAAPWQVDPAGASEAHARAVADSLGLPLIGERQKPGSPRRRGVQWRTHIQLAAAGVLTWGHMPFAPWYDVTSGRAVLAGLPERMPQSLTGIDVDESTGDLVGVRQQPSKNGLASIEEVKIPAKDLIYYVHDREGSAWWGRSMLRSAYAPWLLKQDTLRVHATTLRRFGAGTPVMEPVAGYTPTRAETEAAQVVASNVRVGDYGGAVTPGFSLRIKGIEGSIPDALPFLRYLDEQMARMSLASVLDLGSTPNGSRALGAEFGDLLALALNGIGQSLAGTANKLCVDLTDYNEGEQAPSPCLVVGDVGANPAELASSIADLVSKGGLTMDDGLEDFVRDGLRLPSKVKPVTTEPVGPAGTEKESDGIPADMQGDSKDGQTLAASSRYRTVTAKDGGYRALTDIEAKAGLDPKTIDELTDAAVADAVERWAPIGADWIRQVVEAVQAAAEAGDLASLATWLPDLTDAQAAIIATIADGAAAGAETAADELESQGTPAMAPAITGSDYTAPARALAALIASGLASAALSSATRWGAGDATSATVAGHVRTDLEALSGAYITDRMGAAVQQGLGAGRAAVLEAAPPHARFYASAVRDKSTCAACQANDGREYASLDEGLVDFPAGGYALCLGQSRCRCMLFVRVEDYL